MHSELSIGLGEGSRPGRVWLVKLAPLGSMFLTLHVSQLVCTVRTCVKLTSIRRLRRDSPHARTEQPRAVVSGDTHRKFVKAKGCPCAKTCQVHIIEVSDLKGKDASGTSDPIVHATCLDVTKHTRVRKSVNSAVFDEVLYFSLSNLTRY